MRPLRSALASLTAVCALATGVTVVGTAGPAQAAASDCTGGVRGFHDHPDNASGDTHKPRRIDMGGGIVITLEKGVNGGQQIAFGKISGPTFPGDKVWMDWKADGWDQGGPPGTPIRPWLQCGPFTVQHIGQSLTTPFKRTSTDPAYQFRVCGSLNSNNVIRCSDWW
ncbi:hypothetical protein [Streptomyces gobitricini]|uniref:Secreted protein n=1 Tax=Streptomyces gobitricini TaxID=68211 RepID=A0ABN3M7Z2_9ACTN